ncbi:MAG: cyanophycinase [Bacillota bacterium]
MIIGGGEARSGDTVILDRFSLETQKAGEKRPSSRLIIVPTGLRGDDLGIASEYRDLFLKRGIDSVEVAPIRQRADAHDEATAGRLREAAGIFFTGGDQVRITGILGGTACGDAIYRAFVERAVIGGTSAGASAMSETMVAGGDVDPIPSRGAIRMCPGLGLLSGAVIDQHFSERRRIGRMVTVVAQNPRVLGLGIDENTAALVRPRGSIEVLGEHTVTIFDGAQISYTNVDDLETGGPISVTDLKIHILLAGDRFDMNARKRMPLGP